MSRPSLGQGRACFATSADAGEVESDPQPRLNADQLDDALAHNREGLADLGPDCGDDEQQWCHERAIEQMAHYVAMLRATTTSTLTAAHRPDGRLCRPFSFKLELADGRWSIDEKELDTTPRIGDIVSFDDGLSWRVRATQFVRARPSHKPEREFFVCAPVV
jgi:hypothetical protein